MFTDFLPLTFLTLKWLNKATECSLFSNQANHLKQLVKAVAVWSLWNFHHLFTFLSRPLSLCLLAGLWAFTRNWCLLACNLSSISLTFTVSNDQEKGTRKKKEKAQLSFKLCFPPFWFIISFRSFHLFLPFLLLWPIIVDRAICWWCCYFLFFFLCVFIALSESEREREGRSFKRGWL